MYVISQDLRQVKLKMCYSDYIQSYSQSFFLLHEQSSSLHHQQCQIWQNNEQRPVLGNHADSFQKPTSLRRKIRKGKIYLRIWVIMRDDSSINIVFQLYCHVIFRVASFQIAQVRNPMKKREVVNDGIKI